MRLHKTISVAALLLFLATFLAVLRHDDGETASAGRGEPGEPGGAWGAFEWWYAQRAQPYDMIPAQSFQRAALYARTSVKKERADARLSSSESGWTSLGPINVGGRVLAITVDPSDRNIVWVGSASGGLWRSTTAGIGSTAWNRVATGFPTLSVSAVALDPSAPSTVYIGTGEISLYHRPLIGTPGARSSYGLGVLKSTDAGLTWSLTGLTYAFDQITAIEKIVVNPLNPRTVYAATSEGTYRSRDAGAVWTKIHGVTMAMDLIMSPADTNRLYVSCGSLNSSAGPGLYFSLDAGDSWTQMTNGLPLTNFGRTALAISPSNPAVVYAGIANASTSSTLGLYRTTNGGGNWTLATTTNYVGSQGWYDNVVAVHPSNDALVYCAGFNIHRSSDGGATLPAVSSTGVHVDQHAIAFDPVDPSVMYFGNDGGIFKSTDGGTTYMNINNSFVTTQFYPGFANSVTDTNLFIGGLQDNGTLKHVGYGYWQQIFGGDGGWCAIDPAHANIMYYEFQYLQLYRSVTSGVSAAPIMSGLPIGASNANFIPPFVLSPSSPSVLYAGNKNVYKTTNAGLLWFAPNGGANFNGTPVACIGVSETSPDTLLAATGTGALGVSSAFEVFASLNGGQSWTNVTGSLPDRYPTHLEFDPTNSAVVYITYSGFGTSHVFKSTNVGQSWTDISAGLPDIPHQTIVVDPEYPDHLYLGTDLGVYRSTDAGVSWEDYGTGMPPAMILDLTISRPNSALRASTFGSGLFQRKLHRTPLLSLLSPNGGEKYVSGETRPITWAQKFLEAVRLELSTDGGSSWGLIADNVPASTGSYPWVVPNSTTYHALVRVSDADNDEGSDTSSAEFGIYFNPDVAEGWNLISVDRFSPDPYCTAVFPTSVSRPFRFSGGYIEDDTLDHGVGYWLKFASPQFTDLMGDSLHSDTIDVKTGWNIIGAVSQPVPVPEIIEHPAGIISSFFYGFRSGYYTSDSIMPKRAFWVKVSQDGRLVLPHIPSSPVPPKMGSAAPIAEHALVVTDGAGSSQRIFFTTAPGSERTGRSEMPPAPPAGVFDARFASNQLIESFREPGSRPLLLRDAVYPVTLRWKMGPGASGSFALVSSSGSVPLVGEGSTVIGAPSVLALAYIRRAEEAMPRSFALRQNYPNPFNPSTTIRYDLPEQTRVQVSIYDLLGREVARLVDAVEPSGERSVTWDAGGTPSGIYFCRVKTNSQTASRKMLLLR